MPNLSHMSRSDLERHAREQERLIGDLTRQKWALQEAIREGAADRGPLSLEAALDRAGWVISSRPAFGEMVVIRQKESAAQRQGED